MPFEVNILFVLNTIDQLSCQFFGFNFKYGIIKCAVVNTFMCIFLLTYELKRTLLMTNWFWQWLGTVKYQHISWANIGPDLWCHVTSIDHSQL